jgi:hypothetical protein
MLTSEDHRNPDLPVGTRADLLLREMTVEEKCHQLTGVMPWAVVGPGGSDIAAPRPSSRAHRATSPNSSSTIRTGSPTWSVRSSNGSSHVPGWRSRLCFTPRPGDRAGQPGHAV